MIFYRSFYEALRDLDSDTKATLYDAIFSYGLDFQEPELKGIAKTVFTLIRPQLDANIRKFQNGKTGGRPTKDEAYENQTETKEEPSQNQTETKPKANENGNDNLNANANENTKEAKVSPEKSGNATPTLSERIAKANEMVVPFLNKVAGTSYKANSKATQRLIAARVREGYGWHDFKMVIVGRWEAWKDDKKMSEYIRPSTLFGTKFEEYLSAAKAQARPKPFTREPLPTSNPIL
jgi:uncharacterized phage protein (TIGR02220 family)